MMSGNITIEEIETMTTTQVKQTLSDLCLELSDIDIQLRERKLTMNPADHKVWAKSARTAKMYKEKFKSVCQYRLSVLKSERREAVKDYASEDAEERMIIEEIKILISPSDFIACCDRARDKLRFKREMKLVLKGKITSA